MESRDDSEQRLGDEVLSKGKLESPSSNFTHRVMMNLHSMPVASSLSPRNGILLLCGVVLAVTMLTILVGSGVFDSANGTISLEKLPDVELTKDLHKTIPLSGKWLMNGLIILNIALAFILFDRTVLRPFFNRRVS